jgi:hypothetical protein
MRFLSNLINKNLYRMKKFLLLLFILCMIVMGSIAQTDNRQKMIKEAMNELQLWLKKIPGGNEAGYGFTNRDEFSMATLGKPYQVFALTSDFFKEEIKPGKNYLEATGEWRIPVMVNQENRAVITVLNKKNKWKIVGLGARVLARELQEFERYPELTQNNGLRLLRVYQLQSDFLFADDPSLSSVKINVYPMHSAFMNIAKIREGSKMKLGLNELLPYIKESIK